jgi:hypothetical protein
MAISCVYFYLILLVTWNDQINIAVGMKHCLWSFHLYIIICFLMVRPASRGECNSHLIIPGGMMSNLWLFHRQVRLNLLSSVINIWFISILAKIIKKIYWFCEGLIFHYQIDTLEMDSVFSAKFVVFE